MKREYFNMSGIAARAAAAVILVGLGQQAKASILSTTNYGTGAIDTIYSDKFAAPVVNVNSATTDPNAIVGNVVAGGDGGSGGTPGATYIGVAPPATSTSLPDADWQYSGSSSATIASLGTVTAGEDTSTITNLTLPLNPLVGAVYDLEITMAAGSGTGGHALELAYLFGGGNGHTTSAQALSNNNPTGLILDRDALASGGYVDLFTGNGTGGTDTHFAPSSTGLTGGTVGSAVTFDEIFTPTGPTTGTLSLYLNGFLATPTPIIETGLTGGINYISFGDNRVASGAITNFSLTSQSVPEPTAGLLLLGSGLILNRRRRVAVK